MEKTIELICAACGCKFTRRLCEYNRNIARGHTKLVCSRKCSGKVGFYKIAANCGVKHDKLVRIKDELSPFRRHLSCAKTRSKNFDITIEYLLEVWNAQNGRCPYTGWELVHGTGKANLRTASLDRIDSSKGYIKGNVQFVCIVAQYAKHQFTSEQLVEFCKAVSERKR